jgi:uncharacterized repeat protein (TIGR04042 family)
MLNMPELTFRLRWPDATETVNYSPSTVVKKFFEAERSYSVEDFLARAREALAAASARVQEVHGYPCTRAAATLATIERESAKFAGAGDVTVLAFGA